MSIGKLAIHSGDGFDAMASRVADAWHRAEHGEAVSEDHVTFVTWDSLVNVMSSKRLELLRYLRYHKVVSIAALARELRRDYKRVYKDVEMLTIVGLVQRDETGLRTECDVIESRIAL